MEMEEKKLTAEERAADSARRDKHKNIIRAVSIVVFILAMAGIAYLLLPIVKEMIQDVDKEGGAQDLRERFESHGKLNALLIFIAIQALQVVVAVIPAIQPVGGLLYGWLFGAVVSFAGIVLGALMVWGIVKKLGKPLVEATVGEKHLKRFRFLEDEHKLTIILIILFIIPGVPKDVVTYIVPLTKIKMRDFFFVVLPFRIPSIILSTAFGSNIQSGNYAGAIIISAVILVIAVAGLIFKDKILDHLNKRHLERRRRRRSAEAEE